MSRWFRFYDDTIHDPKTLKLSDKTYRIWIGILCIASKNNGALPPFDDLAILLRIKPEKLQPELEKLIASKLIDHDDGGLRPHNWNKRQYKSDVSTERVKRFRNGERNVSETPPDTEADTEAERKKVRGRATRARAKVPIPDDWAVDEIDAEHAREKGFIESQILLMGQAFSNHHRSKGNLMADWRAAWRTWCGNEIKFQKNSIGARNADDREKFSVGRAAERLIEQGFELGPRPPRPGLVPLAESKAPLRLLSKG